MAIENFVRKTAKRKKKIWCCCQKPIHFGNVIVSSFFSRTYNHWLNCLLATKHMHTILQTLRVNTTNRILMEIHIKQTAFHSLDFVHRRGFWMLDSSVKERARGNREKSDFYFTIFQTIRLIETLHHTIHPENSSKCAFFFSPQTVSNV